MKNGSKESEVNKKSDDASKETASKKKTSTVGRRKTSIARAFIKKGSGKITINGRDMDDVVLTSEKIVKKVFVNKTEKKNGKALREVVTVAGNETAPGVETGGIVKINNRRVKYIVENGKRVVKGYFVEKRHKLAALESLEISNVEVPRNTQEGADIPKIVFSKKDYDILITVKGGGVSSQADAIRLAISRAILLAVEPTKRSLRALGYLTRDSREVERKKYGQAGARRRFQFSKR